MKKAKNWKSEMEESIRNDIPDVKEEPMMPNQSSYVFRPDFILDDGEKRYIIEIKTRQIESRDLAQFSGMVSGSYAQPIFISPKEPTPRTHKAAEEAGITIIAGSPDKVIKKLKSTVGNE